MRKLPKLVTNHCNTHANIYHHVVKEPLHSVLIALITSTQSKRTCWESSECTRSPGNLHRIIDENCSLKRLERTAAKLTKVKGNGAV